MSVEVCFAALIPAMWATSRTFPFAERPRRMTSNVARFIRSSASATATRWVAGLGPTSTIRAEPSGPICESFVATGVHSRGGPRPVNPHFSTGVVARFSTNWTTFSCVLFGSLAVKPTKVTPLSLNSSCMSDMWGIMTIQGPHQVAQNSTT